MLRPELNDNLDQLMAIAPIPDPDIANERSDREGGGRQQERTVISQHQSTSHSRFVGEEGSQ